MSWVPAGAQAGERVPARVSEQLLEGRKVLPLEVLPEASRDCCMTWPLATSDPQLL